MGELSARGWASAFSGLRAPDRGYVADEARMGPSGMSGVEWATDRPAGDPKDCD
jgi:hypothetical protein